MIQTGLIPNAHADLVTDAAYDFYGQRMATCSLDQRIKVWQLDESNNWVLEDEWKAHDAAVSKLSWAHPEFGTVLASSSFDRSVKIWEQTSSGTSDAASSSQPTQGGARWVERAVLSDARGTIRGVEFAPHHFGLKLATIATDNVLRVYECIEQPSLASWALVEELDVLAVPALPSPGSMTRAHTQALATPTQTQLNQGASAPGTSGNAGGASTSTSTPTPINEGGASANLVAQALAASQTPGSGHAQSGSGQRGFGGANREADGGWCLSWCKDRYWGEVVAAGSGTNGIIKVIQINARRSATLLALPATATTATGLSRPATLHSAMHIESTQAPNTGAIATVGLPSSDLSAPADANLNTADDSGAAGSSILALAAPADDSHTTGALDAPGSSSTATAAGAGPGAPIATAPEVLAFPGRSSGKAAPASTNAITAVAWAPSCGRSYHLVATGGRDGRVRVWKVRPGEELGGGGGGDVSMAMSGGEQEDGEGEERWSAMIVADFEHHRSAVTRVEWNVTGTILASAGNDGRVRLWKATARNVWRPAGSVGVEQADSEAPQTQTDSAGREGGLNGHGVDMDTA